MMKASGAVMEKAQHVWKPKVSVNYVLVLQY